MQRSTLVYLEAVGVGATLAGLQAAYQVAAQQQGLEWQPVVAAALLGAVGYALAALRWLMTPPPPPTRE